LLGEAVTGGGNLRNLSGDSRELKWRERAGKNKSSIERIRNWFRI
jgi:hypothetical protein